jgi:hypothetical protein
MPRMNRRTQARLFSVVLVGRAALLFDFQRAVECNAAPESSSPDRGLNQDGRRRARCREGPERDRSAEKGKRVTAVALETLTRSVAATIGVWLTKHLLP